MRRADFAYPFRIAPYTRQAAESPYERHVREMIIQTLLTQPGERVNLPEFGCGLRQMIFRPYADALATATELLVRSALERWLGDHIDVRSVRVPSPSEAIEPGTLLVAIEYELRETRQPKYLEVTIP